MTTPVIDVRNLLFSYFIGDREVPVLKNVSFAIEKGDFVAIQGPSGSGKSTLFYVLGCLLRFKSGQVIINGQDVSHLSNSEMALLRNRQIGFVFQQFHLLPRATVLENILLPTQYPCEITTSREKVIQKAQGLAERLGLGQHINNYPNQLSGGQQQRVAIARALMNEVDIILADEPTGNLDSVNSAEIMGLLRELNAQGKTIVLITHDSQVAKRCARTLIIKDGVMQTEDLKPAKNLEPLSSERIHPPKKSFNWNNLINTIRGVAPLSFDSLKRNKTRSILTMLGVTIGIASVLAMVTFGQFTKDKIIQSYETLGVNKLALRGYPNWHQKATDKTTLVFRDFSWEKDIVPLRDIFPEIRFMTPIFRWWNTTVTFNGHSLDETHVMGTNEDYLTIANRHILYGNNITPYQVAQSSAVCLIGTEIVEKAFINVNPIGQIMFVTDTERGFPCQVIGVMAPQVSNNDWLKPNLEVVMPYTYFKVIGSQWDSELHSVSIQARQNTDMERFSKMTLNYFKRKFGKSAEFWADSDTVLIAQMKKFLTLFSLMLSSVALLSLVVGGIGINNMMLVSVNERLREIGLLKAIGATDESIRLQFLFEAMALCFIAGTIGIIIGFTSYEFIIWIAAKFVSKLTFEWVFDPLAFSISILATLIVGIASGVTPAMKAEKLEVIEALRSE